MANEETGYLVEVIGFNETERLMLSSIFGLAARRGHAIKRSGEVRIAREGKGTCH